MPQRGRQVQRDCYMRRGTARHHRDDAAGVFVSLGLFLLPSERFFERHQLFGSIWRVVSLPGRPENVQIYCLRQRAHRAEYGGKALDHGGAWHRNRSLFEGDNREGCKGLEQLAGAKQEIGIARPAEAFVAAREGLVDQPLHPARERGQSPGAAGGAGNW